MSAVRKEVAPVESLDERIRRTEDRIDSRRQGLAAQTSGMSGSIRKKLSSPWLIAGAVGAGFLFAQFKRSRRGERERERDRRERPEVVMKPSIFATLGDALTLATTLLAMMPLIRSKAKEGVQEATGQIPPS